MLIKDIGPSPSSAYLSALPTDDSILAVVKKANEDIEMMKSLATDVIIGIARHIARRVKKDNPSIDSFVLFIDNAQAVGTAWSIYWTSRT
eukprot:gene24309-32745_t